MVGTKTCSFSTRAKELSDRLGTLRNSVLLKFTMENEMVDLLEQVANLEASVAMHSKVSLTSH
jgi:hypothetical protein